MARPVFNRAVTGPPQFTFGPLPTIHLPSGVATDASDETSSPTLERIPTLLSMRDVRDESNVSLNEGGESQPTTPRPSFETLESFHSVHSFEDFKIVEHLDPASSGALRHGPDVLWFGRKFSIRRSLRSTRSADVLPAVTFPGVEQVAVTPPAPLDIALPPISEEIKQELGISATEAAETIIPSPSPVEQSTHTSEGPLDSVPFTPLPQRVVPFTPVRTPISTADATTVSTPCKAKGGIVATFSFASTPVRGLVRKGLQPVETAAPAKAPPEAPRKGKPATKPVSMPRRPAPPRFDLSKSRTSKDPFAPTSEVRKRPSIVGLYATKAVEGLSKGYANLTMRDNNRIGAESEGRETGANVATETGQKGESWSEATVLDIADLECGRKLGSGSFGHVFEAQVGGEGTVYAVKRLGTRNDATMSEHRIEAAFLRFLAQPGHPHIVQYICSGEYLDKPSVHIATELCSRGDLKAHLFGVSQAGGLGEARAWKVLAEVSSGLEYIHSRRVCHIDIKPENIYIMADGRLKIGDFGCASGVDEHGFSTHAVPSRPVIAANGSHRWTVGAPYHADLAVIEGMDRPDDGEGAYMSQDCRKGVKADIFSLGIVMVEIACNVVMPSGGEVYQALRSDECFDLVSKTCTMRRAAMDPLFDLAQTPPSPVLSSSLVELVTLQMLASNLERRPTAAEIRMQPVIEHLRASGVSPALADENDRWYLDYLQMPPPPLPAAPVQPEMPSTPKAASTPVPGPAAEPPAPGRRASLLKEVKRKTSARALKMYRGAQENRASISGKISSALGSGSGIPVAKPRPRPVSLAVAVSHNPLPTGRARVGKEDAAMGTRETAAVATVAEQAPRPRARPSSVVPATTQEQKPQKTKAKWRL